MAPFRLKQLLALQCLLVCSAAEAQDIGGVFDMGTMTGTASMDPAIEQSREMAIRRGERDPLPGRPRAGRPLTQSLAGAFARSRAAPDAASDLAWLTYRPSTSVRAANFARFVESSRQHDPDGAERLALLLKQDVLGEADKWMKPFGLVSTNVADATAVYLVHAWLATRGRSDDPSLAQMKSLRAQVVSAMLSTPEFRVASDAEKQEMAEAMIVQATLASQFVELAKTRPDFMPMVKKTVAQGAQNTFGFDLRKMDLTDAGLQ